MNTGLGLVCRPCWWIYTKVQCHQLNNEDSSIFTNGPTIYYGMNINSLWHEYQFTVSCTDPIDLIFIEKEPHSQPRMKRKRNRRSLKMGIRPANIACLHVVIKASQIAQGSPWHAHSPPPLFPPLHSTPPGPKISDFQEERLKRRMASIQRLKSDIAEFGQLL